MVTRQLEELEEAGPFIRRRHEPERAVAVGEQHSRDTVGILDPLALSSYGELRSDLRCEAARFTADLVPRRNRPATMSRATPLSGR